MSNQEIDRLERRILQLVEQLGSLKDILDYSEEKCRRAKDNGLEQAAEWVEYTGNVDLAAAIRELKKGSK